MSNYTELEYKYKADDIKLSDFVQLMNTLAYRKRLDISSWDHYYTTKSPDVFQRYRESDTPELTKKIKTSTSNNWERVEVDLPLDRNKITKAIVDKYLSLSGYLCTRSIYKSCFIFWLDNVNYVYYIVYDENMKEKGRFIEVEVNKDQVNSLRTADYNVVNDKFVPTGKDSAMEALTTAAEQLKNLGLSPQNRLKRSLFEIFVNE